MVVLVASAASISAEEMGPKQQCVAACTEKNNACKVGPLPKPCEGKETKKQTGCQRVFCFKEMKQCFDDCEPKTPLQCMDDCRAEKVACYDRPIPESSSCNLETSESEKTLCKKMACIDEMEFCFNAC